MCQDPWIVSESFIHLLTYLYTYLLTFLLIPSEGSVDGEREFLDPQSLVTYHHRRRKRHNT